MCSSLIEILQNVIIIQSYYGRFSCQMDEWSRKKASLHNKITKNSFHSIQLITEQSLTIYKQTSLIFMLFQESWKHILLLTRPFSCPFHFKLKFYWCILPFNSKLYLKTCFWDSNCMYITRKLIQPDLHSFEIKMFLKISIQIIQQLCGLK